MFQGNWTICKLFKLINIPEKKNIKPKVKGKNIFHPINISWSNLNLGKFARININKKVIKIVLKAKKKSWIKQMIKILLKKKVTSNLIISNNPPPKKNITNNTDINKIFAYSPKKNIAKVIEEYSTLYPATNSASASGKSNGARFVSARIDIKKIKAKGSNGNKNQIVSFCITIIWFKFNEPDNKIIGIIIKLIETS